MKHYNPNKFYSMRRHKIDNIEINKKETIDLSSVDTSKIVISDKFRHSDDGFKYFIGYKEDDIVKPLCVILTQMSGYIKYFETGGILNLL